SREQSGDDQQLLNLTGLTAIPLTVAFIAGIEFWLPSLDFILSSPVYWIVIVVTTLSITFAPILDQSGLAMRRADLILFRTVAASVLKIPIALLLLFFAVTGCRDRTCTRLNSSTEWIS